MNGNLTTAVNLAETRVQTDSYRIKCHLTQSPSVRQNRIFEQTGNKTFNSQPTNLFLIMNMNFEIQTHYTRTR